MEIRTAKLMWASLKAMAGSEFKATPNDFLPECCREEHQQTPEEAMAILAATFGPPTEETEELETGTK